MPIVHSRYLGHVAGADGFIEIFEHVSVYFVHTSVFRLLKATEEASA